MWITEHLPAQITDSDRKLRFLDVSRVSSEGGWYYPLHSHEWFETIFCIDGSGLVTVQATTFHLTKGTALLIRPNTFHSFYGDDKSDFKYCVLSFWPDTESSSVSFLLNHPYNIADFSEYIPLVEASYRLLFETYINGSYTEHPVFSALCEQLFQLLTYVFRQNSLPLPLQKNTLTDGILEYIERHYSEDIGLEDIAKAFSISVPHISRLFKAAYNISLVNYLIDYRLSIAKAYLTRTNLSVRKIGEMVGYGNPAHFCRLFLKRTGSKPTDYRKNYVLKSPGDELPLNLVKTRTESYGE